MGTESNDGDEAPLSPGDAFAALGNETRVRILEALATADRADRPLSFSDLRERVGAVDSSNFNYHLDTLVGHFVERSDDGYTLRRSGKRVAEAVLSGAVSGDPVIERTRVDHSCPHCGAPVEVSYRRERTAAYCTECAGTYGGRGGPEVPVDEISVEYGYLGMLNLPAAGVTDRTPSDVYRAALAWQLSENLLSAAGTCPRCSAPLDEWVDCCEDHESTGGGCEHCGNRYAVQHSASCTNCVFARRVAFAVALLDDTDLQAFLTTHGVNLAAPEPDQYGPVLMDYEETVLGTDPFEAAFTFTAGGDAITLTVDDELSVVDVSEHAAR